MNILVLCTGNSARSILGEVLIDNLDGERFRAFSAGSRPVGRVNPGAIAKLEREGHLTEGLSSKSWDEFANPDSPQIDLVITVCDSAAGESCPIWPGHPAVVHWGIPDPAHADDIDAAFDRAYDSLRRRIEAMAELELEDLDNTAIVDALTAIHAREKKADSTVG
ncbi:MAG: arsenate reductase ArsC [Woeseiaceae bacterium]|nr:arsenate reductase ArsC [Woeseiaceae bacterium]